MKNEKGSIIIKRMGESSSAKDGSISEFIVQYRSYVYASALKILKDTYRAEDCTQMTFEQVCRNTEKIYSMDEQGVRSYLYRMIHNCAMDIFRKETRSVAMDREKLEMHINREQTDEILAESDWSDRFEELFSNLTTEEVYLVIRRHKERMTYAEIAAELDLSEEEIEAYLAEMKERRESGESWENAGLSLTAFKAEDGSQGILVQQDWPSGTSDKVTIHMEKFGGIEGPFEFEADIPVKGEPMEYTGDISFTAAGGREMTLTKVCIYPLSGISAEMYGKDVSLESLEADEELCKSVEISAVLWNDTEVRGRESGRQSAENRLVVFMKDFQEQAITPEDVTKIQIGDEWFELSKMKKTGDAGGISYDLA